MFYFSMHNVRSVPPMTMSPKIVYSLIDVKVVLYEPMKKRTVHFHHKLDATTALEPTHVPKRVIAK